MKGLRTTSISILAIGLLAGSAIGVAAQTDHEPSSASAGCAEPLAEPGVYEGINDFDDAAQAYRVVVPESYADLAPAPLILFVAAAGGDLDRNLEWWRPYLGPAESVFVVASIHRETSTLTALIDQLEVEYCIDQRRIHAMGNSLSSDIMPVLACGASDRIASVFAGMGFFPPLCESPRPVPLMATTGDPDRLAVSTSVDLWATHYGCDAEPLTEDLGSGVTRTAYQGCLADIVLYDVEGAGHGFIRQECLGTELGYCIANDVFDLLREVELYFAEHPLPAVE